MTKYQLEDKKSQESLGWMVGACGTDWINSPVTILSTFHPPSSLRRIGSVAAFSRVNTRQQSERLSSGVNTPVPQTGIVDILLDVSACWSTPSSLHYALKLSGATPLQGANVQQQSWHFEPACTTGEPGSHPAPRCIYMPQGQRSNVHPVVSG